MVMSPPPPELADLGPLPALAPIATGQLAGPHTHQGGERLALSCFFLLGAGVLAPWNAFITASDYYAAVWPGRHIDRTLTVTYLPVCLAFLGVFVWRPNIPERPRILGAFAGFTIIMAVMPALDALLLNDGTDGDGGGGGSAPGGEAALGLLVAAVALVGVLDGVSQGAIFSDAAQLPPRFTHAIVGGTASSGVLISAIRMATKAALPATRAGLSRSVSLYFALAGALCLACLLAYAFVLPRLPVVAYYRRLAADQNARRAAAAATAGTAGVELSPRPGGGGGGFARSAEAAAAAAAAGALGGGGGGGGLAGPAMADEASRPLVHRGSGSAAHLLREHYNGSGSATSSSGNASPASPPRAAAGGGVVVGIGPPRCSGSGGKHAAAAGGGGGGRASLSSSSRPLSPPSSPPPPPPALRWQRVAREAWPSLAAIFALYVVTLSIFPGVLAEDLHAAGDDGGWLSVWLIAAFNVADLAGKNAPFCGLRPPPKALLAASLARAAFVPAFYAAGHVYHSAAGVAVLSVLLGLSNGLLTAMLMTLAPESVAAHHVGGGAAAGLLESMLVFSLVLGLTVGACCGWLWLV